MLLPITLYADSFHAFLPQEERLIVNTPFLLFAALMLVVMFIFNSRARKRMAEQEKKAEARRKEMMVPGAWVRMRSGFWGRFVDQDGEIVILETPGGHETYWDQRAILDVAEELPFQSTEAEKDDASDESEEEPVLGLDSQDDSAETK